MVGCGQNCLNRGVIELEGCQFRGIFQLKDFIRNMVKNKKARMYMYMVCLYFNDFKLRKYSRTVSRIILHALISFEERSNIGLNRISHRTVLEKIQISWRISCIQLSPSLKQSFSVSQISSKCSFSYVWGPRTFRCPCFSVPFIFQFESRVTPF